MTLAVWHFSRFLLHLSHFSSHLYLCHLWICICICVLCICICHLYLYLCNFCFVAVATLFPVSSPSCNIFQVTCPGSTVYLLLLEGPSTRPVTAQVTRKQTSDLWQVFTLSSDKFQWPPFPVDLWNTIIYLSQRNFAKPSF